MLRRSGMEILTLLAVGCGSLAANEKSRPCKARTWHILDMLNAKVRRMPLHLPYTSSHPAFLDLRRHSLSRGNALVLISFAAAVLMSDFPRNRATMLLLLPTLLALVGTGETVRCMRRRWDYYHAGVILCIYMDLMAICMIVFFLIYPYWHFLAATG